MIYINRTTFQEFDSFPSSPYRTTGDDTSRGDSLQRKGANNDGWFRRDSLVKGTPQQLLNSNPDDEVVDFPGANEFSKNGNDVPGHSTRPEGVDCVIIERDKTGT